MTWLREDCRKKWYILASFRVYEVMIWWGAQCHTWNYSIFSHILNPTLVRIAFLRTLLLIFHVWSIHNKESQLLSKPFNRTKNCAFISYWGICLKIEISKSINCIITPWDLTFILHRLKQHYLLNFWQGLLMQLPDSIVFYVWFLICPWYARTFSFYQATSTEVYPHKVLDTWLVVVFWCSFREHGTQLHQWWRLAFSRIDWPGSSRHWRHWSRNHHPKICELWNNSNDITISILSTFYNVSTFFKRDQRAPDCEIPFQEVPNLSLFSHQNLMLLKFFFSKLVVTCHSLSNS